MSRLVPGLRSIRPLSLAVVAAVVANSRPRSSRSIWSAAGYVCGMPLTFATVIPTYTTLVPGGGGSSPAHIVYSKVRQSRSGVANPAHGDADRRMPAAVGPRRSSSVRATARATFHWLSSLEVACADAE